jgi:copper chaperone CopZ
MVMKVMAGLLSLGATVDRGAVRGLFDACRLEPERARPPGSPDRGRTADRARLWDVPVVRSEPVSVVEMQVPGMTCRHCVRAVTARLRDLPGVVAVEADSQTARLVVHGDVTADDVQAALREVSFADDDPGHDASLVEGG